MKNIKSMLTTKNSKSKYTQEDYDRMEIETTNNLEGSLNLEDGIDCPICKNKGYIAVLEGKYIVYQDCTCKKKRIIANRLKHSGVSKTMLEHYTFKTYKTEEAYNKTALDKVIEYCKEIVEGKTYWLYLGGVTGVGKTHLCIATFQGLIQKGLFSLAEYMNWNEEINKLVALSKSFDTREYDSRLATLQNADLLYIDDFLKLSNLKYSDESVSMAFRILDFRYRNDKITIISSEFTPYSLSKVDKATAGRINEKADFGRFNIDMGEDEARNYRLKNFS